MPKKKPGYYENVGDKANRILNLALGMAEKIGVESPVEQRFQVAVPAEGFKQQAANTTNPSRPRAKAIAYDFDKRSLYVVFRDGSWWEYENCPVSHYENLKNTDSTGKYLASSGLDRWPTMGPADPLEMTEEQRTRFEYAAEASARLQQTLILEEDRTQLRGD